MSLEYVELVCERCGTTYKRREQDADRSRYCSKECQYGWNTPSPGDTRKKSKRGRVLERDGCVCQRCESKVGAKDSSLKTAEVHHIIPTAAGGPDAVENMITLCQSCHTKAHNDLSQVHETRPGLLDEVRTIVCDE
jgi:5-methylcytosine-specific restriction endonuclease McrA